MIISRGIEWGSLFLCFSCLLTACGHAKVRMYEGPALPKDKICFVSAENALIKSVNRKEVDIQGYWLELLPGEYDIEARYALTSRYYAWGSVGRLPVRLKCEAGHNYVIYGKTNPDNTWYPVVVDIGHYSFDEWYRSEQRRRMH